jgi:tetratricopeptide (TPR) repeat protein
VLKIIITFIKNTYKITGVILLAVIFFLGYNTYLVDYSLVNLKFALNKTSEVKALEDFVKIKHLLKVPLLKEVSRTNTSTRALMSLELVENIATTAKTQEQIEDIKFYLKEVIAKKEKERGIFLSSLDRLNNLIFKPMQVTPQEKLEARARSLSTKIGTFKDKKLQQKAYYDLGNIYMQLDQPAKAEESFLKAIQIDPLNPIAVKAKFNLGWNYKSSGEFDKAVACFEDLEKEHPEAALAITGEFQIADTLYKSAAALYKQGDYEKARDKYALLTEKYPEFDITDLALFEAGYISYHNLSDVDAAVKYFSKLEEKYPKTNIVQHVEKEVRKVLSTDFRRQGFNLLKEKKYQEAVENFQKAIEIAPYDSRSFSGMSLCFYWLGDKEMALEKAKKAVDVSFEDAVTIINTLFVYINCGKLEEAIKIGEESLAKWDPKRTEFFYNLGYAYTLQGKIDLAVDNYNRALKFNPDFVFAYNNLGCNYWAITSYSEAIKRFKGSIDIEPDYVEGHFNLGVAYFYLKQFEEAHSEFKNVLGLKPEYKEAESYLRRSIKSLGYQP